MVNKPLTIVIVNDFDYVQGGASKVAIDTAKMLYEKDINVIFFSSTHKENDYKFKQITTNQKECLKDGIKGALRGLYNFKAAKEFRKLLNTLDRNNTVIHVHGWTKSLSSSIFKVAFKMHFNVVLTIHDYFTMCPNGGFYNYKKNVICKYNPLSIECLRCNCDSRNILFKIYRVFRQIIQNYNMKCLKNVITISDFSENILKKCFNNSINRYRVYNPIDVKKHNRVKVENNNKYIFIGRVSKEKGVSLFCEAITKLKLDGLVIGDGPLLSELKEKYKNIEFAGWIKHEDVNKFYKNAKALIFPSLWYEGAPLTTLEVLSIGIPCIVSSKCAAKDFVKNDFNGLQFDGSINDLIKKIKKYEKLNISLLSDNAFKNYWKNPFNSKLYYNNLLSCYIKILKG